MLLLRLGSCSWSIRCRPCGSVRWLPINRQYPYLLHLNLRPPPNLFCDYIHNWIQLRRIADCRYPICLSDKSLICIQGLTNLGGIVGIVIAICVSGPLTDWGTVWLAKRNKGVYEPEFRIFFVSTMLFGVFGYAGWAGRFQTLVVDYEETNETYTKSWHDS